MAASTCTDVHTGTRLATMRDAPDPAPPRVGVGVVVLRAGHVLLIRRAKPPRQGEWSLPGGRQEAGETLHDCARREVLEETGITIRVTRLLDVLDLIAHDASGTLERHYTLVDFQGEALAGEPVAGDDALHAAWVPIADLPGLGLWSETMRVIRLAIAGT